jgi:uncharacterized protein YjbJ (UPF0337 family)
MSLTDKARNKAEEFAGAAKEKFGDVTDNERMQAEGATRRREAKQAGEQMAQAGRGARTPSPDR